MGGEWLICILITLIFYKHHFFQTLSDDAYFCTLKMGGNFYRIVWCFIWLLLKFNIFSGSPEKVLKNGVKSQGYI